MTATRKTCSHVSDFEYSLSLPFDPQGRDNRPFDDSTVKCWQCGQTWTKANSAVTTPAAKEKSRA